MQCMNTMHKSVSLLNDGTLTFGSSMKWNVLLLLGLLEGTPGRGSEKLKKLFVGDFIASTSKNGITIKTYQRLFNLVANIWWSVIR